MQTERFLQEEMDQLIAILTEYNALSDMNEVITKLVMDELMRMSALSPAVAEISIKRMTIKQALVLLVKHSPQEHSQAFIHSLILSAVKAVSDDKKIDEVAATVLKKHMSAFKKLAE